MLQSSPAVGLLPSPATSTHTRDPPLRALSSFLASPALPAILLYYRGGRYIPGLDLDLSMKPHYPHSRAACTQVRQ